MSGKVINYRNVFKSDHLGCVDLEEYAENGQKAIFTINRVEQFDENNKTKVAGKMIACNIVHFEGKVKPWVANATNCKIISGFAKTINILKWGGLVIELYADPKVTMKGAVTGGVKVRTTQPVITLRKLTPSDEQWQMAIGKVKDGMTLEAINEFFTVDAKTYKDLQDA